MRAAEIPTDVLPGVPSFLVCYHHAAMGSDCSKSAGHRFVVTKQSITVQLDGIIERQLQIIQGKRTCRVPGNEDALPSGEILVNLLSGLLDLLLHRFDFTLEIDSL